MSTDRELIELAAKAAGIPVHVWGTKGRENFADMSDPSNHKLWSPLTDDGDALRLAVKLRLDIEFHWREGGVSSMNYEACGEFNMQGASEKLAPDDGAATRRAIVRAAAQFGEAMP